MGAHCWGLAIHTGCGSKNSGHSGLWPKPHNLSKNSLNGTIPGSIGTALTNLAALHLQQNPGLGGPIPASLGGLGGLPELNLYSCGLARSLPSSFGTLTRLRDRNLCEGYGVTPT